MLASLTQVALFFIWLSHSNQPIEKLQLLWYFNMCSYLYAILNASRISIVIAHVWRSWKNIKTGDMFKVQTKIFNENSFLWESCVFFQQGIQYLCISYPPHYPSPWQVTILGVQHTYWWTSWTAWLFYATFCFKIQILHYNPSLQLALKSYPPLTLN